MSLQLNPRERFTIVRQIEDHTDNNQYYVRATIRNALTDVLIDTINLVDKGSRRFSKDWLVPVDGSGQGFFISILIETFEDAGHTTKSGNYGDKLDTYLVQDRLNANLGGFGGGSDIDYKKIRKIVQEEIEKIPPVDVPEAQIVTREVVKEVRVPEIVRVENYKEVIKEVKVPQIVEKTLEPDLSGLTSSLKEIQAKLDEWTIKTKEKEEISNDDLVLSPIQNERVEKLLGKPSLRAKKLL